MGYGFLVLEAKVRRVRNDGFLDKCFRSFTLVFEL